jgi:hypothetical protein
MSEVLKSTTSLAVPSATLLAKMKADGRTLSGLSNDPGDMMPPRLCIAQTNSPQVDRRDPVFIEGLQPGGLFISSTGMCFDGETGVPAISCGQVPCVVQWGAERSGFIARHATMPSDARQERVEGRRRPVVVNAAGDIYEEQREIYLVINAGQEWLPCVYSAKSTGHTMARKWQTDLHMRCKHNGSPLPAYAHIYQLTTVGTRNPLGAWFLLRPGYVGLVADDPVYDAAKQFAEFVNAGRAFVDHSDEG